MFCHTAEDAASTSRLCGQTFDITEVSAKVNDVAPRAFAIHVHFVCTQVYNA